MIIHLKGDATSPIISEGKIGVICHICNDVGAWGKGFVLALSKKWEEPEQEYRRYWNAHQKLSLGDIQQVKVEENILVVNMIGQHDIRWNEGVPPIRYWAVRTALNKVQRNFQDKDLYQLHCPKFGAGLAGGDWHTIENIIADVFPEHKVFIYNY